VEVCKRIATIGRAQSFVDWQRQRALAEDLDTQRRAIVEKIAAALPDIALELMWRFMDLAPSIHERTDDSNGVIGGIFDAACADLGPIAEAARPDPLTLADQVFAALQARDYGQFDGLIEYTAPTLGAVGLAHLKKLVEALAQQPVETPPEAERVVVGWSPGRGKIYADEVERSHRESIVRYALQDIADAEGDVDGFIAQYDEDARRAPRIAAVIAMRLLAAGRAGEALDAVDAADPGQHSWIAPEWHEARLAALEALGRNEEAQAFRWECFEASFSPGHLRAYLDRLPDFDDVEAEERALGIVAGHDSALEALHFLIHWKAFDRAAALVLARAGELDGNHYEILAPAAEALAGPHPLAASIALRAMIDFTLDNARSSRYGHAARDLALCASLAAEIDDFGAFETHEAFRARIDSKHRRKSGFWSRGG